MEKHIVTFLFLLLVIYLSVGMIRAKKMRNIEVSFILFSLGYIGQLFFNDGYKIWSFFWGAGLGCALVSILKLRRLRTVEEHIRRKLEWKIPLLTALAINALGRFGAEWLAWGSILLVTGLLFIEYKKQQKFMIIALFAIELSLIGTSLLQGFQIIFSILIVATIYMFVRIHREIS